MKRGILYISLIICIFFENNIYANRFFHLQSIDLQDYITPTFHPVHISFTNIEYNQTTKKFEILIKLFVDDFNVILNRKYGKNINLNDNQQLKGSHETINSYINEHFKLTINGKDKAKSQLELNKMEIKELSIWLYYDFSYKGVCSTFDIYNSLMTDLYQDQTNLLIFTYKDEQKAFKFNIGKPKEQLTL